MLLGATATHAAESQKRIPGVVAVDLMPPFARSAQVGECVTYLNKVKNLGKKTVTWPIAAWIEPADAHVTATTSSPLVLKPQQETRHPVKVCVEDGAVPDTEVLLINDVNKFFDADDPQRRKFTVCGPTPPGCSHHPR